MRQHDDDHTNLQKVTIRLKPEQVTFFTTHFPRGYNRAIREILDAYIRRFRVKHKTQQEELV